MHEIGQAAAPEPDFHLTRRSATYEGIDDDLPLVDPLMNYSVGLSSVLIAAAVSGLAGVYFEKILKESPTPVSVWIRNVQLSFYSLIAALIGGVFWQDGTEIQEHGFFEGYNWVVWTVVILQAVGGLISSVVIRDAGNIVKNFATSISIILSFLISMWMFEFEVTLTVSLPRIQISGSQDPVTDCIKVPRWYQPSHARNISIQRARSQFLPASAHQNRYVREAYD